MDRALRRALKDPWARLGAGVAVLGGGLAGASEVVSVVPAIGMVGLVLIGIGIGGAGFVFLQHLVDPRSAVRGRFLYAYISGTGARQGRSDRVTIDAALCYENGEEETNLSHFRTTLGIGSETYAAKQYADNVDVLPYASIHEVAGQQALETRGRLAGGLYGAVILDRPREVHRLSGLLRVECEDSEGYPITVTRRVRGRDRPTPHAFYPELQGARRAMVPAPETVANHVPEFSVEKEGGTYWLRVTATKTGSYEAHARFLRGEGVVNGPNRWTVAWEGDGHQECQIKAGLSKRAVLGWVNSHPKNGVSVGFSYWDEKLAKIMRIDSRSPHHRASGEEEPWLEYEVTLASDATEPVAIVFRLDRDGVTEVTP